MRSQEERGLAFRALHEGEPFVIPNPWDAGSARVLEALGFEALATTSSGFAFTLGRLDGQATLDEVATHVEELAARDRPPRLRRSRERLRGGPAGRRACDRARRRGGCRRRVDRGLGSRRSALRAGGGGRAARGCGRGRPRTRLPVPPDRARGEPHPREPGPRRHDRAPAGVRDGRRRRPLRAGTANRRGDPRRSATR